MIRSCIDCMNCFDSMQEEGYNVTVYCRIKKERFPHNLEENKDCIFYEERSREYFVRKNIRQRLNDKEYKPYHCRFYITVPQYNGDMNFYDRIQENKYLKEVYEILKRNNVYYQVCDTVPGTFNLNRDFMETDIMDCIVEYNAVYPIHMNPADIVKLIDMDTDGNIIILVSWFNDKGDFICMNQ